MSVVAIGDCGNVLKASNSLWLGILLALHKACIGSALLSSLGVSTLVMLACLPLLASWDSELAAW